MMLNGGTLDGTRIISRKTVEYMTFRSSGRHRGPHTFPAPGMASASDLRCASLPVKRTHRLDRDYNWAAGWHILLGRPEGKTDRDLDDAGAGPRGYYR